ncbi:MAG: alpha/beta hydrolase [Pseudomonadota bacterium]
MPPPPTKPATPKKSPLKHLRPSDLRGVAQLATQATSGVATMAEGVHHAVLGTMGLAGNKAGQQTSGITGFVYRTVRGVTELVGKGLHAAFTKLEPLLATLVDAPPDTPEREAVLAALNGVLGDQLAQNHNPLATPMTLRYQGQALNLHALHALPAMPDASGKVLLLIHGLCMNDLQWMPGEPAAEDGKPVADIAATLAIERDFTPIYLRYNTGRHTSQNGRELASMLEQLLAHWPIPVLELTVVVHSMGGLVIRSALHTAQQESRRWPQQLKNIVFLGTPHHGAPLERAGNWIDVILGATPFSKPFAKLGQLRSSGITDLRFGHVLDADWAGQDRFKRKPDSRQPLPLPEGVVCYTVAATTAGKRSPLAERTIGDGLVPLPSALGQHTDPRHQLTFAKANQVIVYRTNHMQMIHSPEVALQLLQWLK